MKIIKRTNQPPQCLTNYKHGRDNWNKVTFIDKESIRDSLYLIQNKFCAYCESTLNSSVHIEHFAPKDTYPKLTFEWSNLFLSCNGQSHCGHFKDSRLAPSYNYLNLIKPDKDCPSDFLIFNSNGLVSPLENLSSEHLLKAETTINVFNLNETNLKNKRSSILAGVTTIVQYIYSLNETEEIQNLIEHYRKEYLDSEFSAAKLQLLLPS